MQEFSKPWARKFEGGRVLLVLPRYLFGEISDRPTGQIEWVNNYVTVRRAVR